VTITIAGSLDGAERKWDGEAPGTAADLRSVLCGSHRRRRRRAHVVADDRPTPRTCAMTTATMRRMWFRHGSSPRPVGPAT